MKRRDFLKGSVFGVGVLQAPFGSALLASDAQKPSAAANVCLKSRHLRLEHNTRSGRVSLYMPDGSPLLLHATAAAVLSTGTLLTSDPRYVRHSRVGRSSEPGLSGEQLTVDCQDTAQTVNCEICVTLLDDWPVALFELVLTNASRRDLCIRHAEPVRALLSERAGCQFGATEQWTAVRQILTNGYMHYNPGVLLSPAAYTHQDFTSWWNAAFYIPQPQETMVVGYLDNRDAEGQVVAGWDMARGWPAGQAAFNLTARSLYNQGFLLKPGASVRSGRVWLSRQNDPFVALESYAEMCGRIHKVKLNPVINGWCSWFYTNAEPSEAEQLRNAAFIAQRLKGYGMEWVQIDDGYQRAFGDWEGNGRFPHGMKWLADRIRQLGLKPGIWVAPFVVSENTEIAVQHPEWLVHDPDGSVRVIANSRAKYALDVTHPQARQWLFNLFKTIADDWGYDFIKIDFVEWSLLAAQCYYDRSVSRAQAYRMAIETIRKAIGPNRHLLDCGPAADTVGLTDSMRIEADLPRLTWDQYVKNPNSTAPAMARRYYFHKRTWINDADQLGLGLLTIPQGRSAASLIALSGGTVISGDRLVDLDPARLDILTKVLPAYGEAARPLDLFENDYPEIFALPIRKDSEKWWVLGYFNYDENATKDRELDLARLGLDRKKTYLAYEFWSQRLVATTGGKLHLHFEPSAVNLVAIRARSGLPQLLGTNRHVTQGAIELEQVRWDPATQTLSGAALGVPGTKWRFAVYVPPGFTLDGTSCSVPQEQAAFTVVSCESAVLQAEVSFATTNRVPWSLKWRGK